MCRVRSIGSVINSSINKKFVCVRYVKVVGLTLGKLVKNIVNREV